MVGVGLTAAHGVKHTQQRACILHVVQRLVHHTGVELVAHVLFVEGKYLRLCLRYDLLGVFVVRAVDANIGQVGPEGI